MIICFYIINIYVIERWDNSAEQCKENDTRSLSSHGGVDVSGRVFPTFPPKPSDHLRSELTMLRTEPETGRTNISTSKLFEGQEEPPKPGPGTS